MITPIVDLAPSRRVRRVRRVRRALAADLTYGGAWLGSVVHGLFLCPWNRRSKWAFVRVMCLMAPWRRPQQIADAGRALLYLDAQRRQKGRA